MSIRIEPIERAGAQGQFQDTIAHLEGVLRIEEPLLEAARHQDIAEHAAVPREHPHTEEVEHEADLMVVVHARNHIAVLQVGAHTDLAAQVEVAAAIVHRVVRLEVPAVTEVQAAHLARIPAEGLPEEEGHQEGDLREDDQAVVEGVNKPRKFH